MRVHRIEENWYCTLVSAFISYSRYFKFHAFCSCKYTGLEFDNRIDPSIWVTTENHWQECQAEEGCIWVVKILTSCWSPFHPLKPVPMLFEIMSEFAIGLGLPYCSLSKSLNPWLGVLPEILNISANIKRCFNFFFSRIREWKIIQPFSCWNLHAYNLSGQST